LARADRLQRTPLLFETLEPRVLLSSDPLTAAAQTALLGGLHSFENWTHNHLQQAAQLVQQLPVVSTPVGFLVDLPEEVDVHITTPAQNYFATAATPTIQSLAAALQQDPAETGTVLGQFAQGELLITLSVFKTGLPVNPNVADPITASLGVAADTTEINLQVGQSPTLSGQATVSMALTFGYAEAGNAASVPVGFFIDPTTITEGVALSASNFNTTATLGAADATVTGGSASVSATATAHIQHPIATDPYTAITQADLAQTGAVLPSMISTNLAGTASLTLPISSPLVAGGPQTLALNWSGNLASVGSSNIASLGAWEQLGTISGKLLQKAIGALPGLISAATGNAGFGAAVPGFGPGLGQLLTVGNDFSVAASSAGGTPSLDQVATALQNAGFSVSFAVDTANDVLDMQLSARSAIDAALPYAIDVPVGNDTLTLNGSLPVSGTATASLHLALSFDTALPDSDRIQLITTDSMLGLAFTAAAPIAGPAALGLLRPQVNGGSIEVVPQTPDPTAQATATATVTFSGGNGRVAVSAAAAVSAKYNGAVKAVLPLTFTNGSQATLGAAWQLGQPANSNNPAIIGAEQVAALATPLSQLTIDPPLDAEALAGLPSLVQWASAVTTAADQTTLLTTQIPLINQTLGQLSGLAPATSGPFPGFLNEIANAVSAYAVSGASTDGFVSAIESTLASFAAANPGLRLHRQPREFRRLHRGERYRRAASPGANARHRSIRVQPGGDRDPYRKPDVQPHPEQ
jgi:hypothetical protein